MKSKQKKNQISAKERTRSTLNAVPEESNFEELNFDEVLESDKLPKNDMKEDRIRIFNTDGRARVIHDSTTDSTLIETHDRFFRTSDPRVISILEAYGYPEVSKE